MTDQQGATGPAPTTDRRVDPAGAKRWTATGRVRSLTVGLAYLFTLLSLVLATTTWWLHDTVLDTDRFVALTAPLVDDPVVQEQLVTVTSAQLDEALALGPLATYVVTGISREVYASDAFADVWAAAMRQVHTRVVALLEGDSANVQLSDGQIVLNLFPLYQRVAERVNGLNFEVGDRALQVPALTNPEDPDASRAELSAALGRTLSPTFGTGADRRRDEARDRADLHQAVRRPRGHPVHRDRAVRAVDAGFVPAAAADGGAAGHRRPGGAARGPAHRELRRRRDQRGHRDGRSGGDHRRPDRARHRPVLPRVRADRAADRPDRGRGRDRRGVAHRAGCAPGYPGRCIGKGRRRLVPRLRRHGRRPRRPARVRPHHHDAGAGGDRPGDLAGGRPGVATVAGQRLSPA